MRVRSLSLGNFRNLASQRLELPAAGIALVADNARGKSSFLEAIYYLETFRSFRGARDDQLVRFGEEFFRVEAEVEGADGPVRVAAAWARGGRKRVTIGGDEFPRLGDALGRVGAILFAPSDLALVTGGPSERRRFLDILLSLNVRGYLEALQRFRQGLARRNAVLRDGGSPALVRAWDQGLSEDGARVAATRMTWVDRYRSHFARYSAAIADGSGSELRLRSSIAARIDGAGDGEHAEQPGNPTLPTESMCREAYGLALERGLEADRKAGVTRIGPHRDELRIEMEGPRRVDLRDFGSGGQKRTAALALRLVEADTLRDTRGSEPLILLDDVLAELDAGRSRRILDLFEGSREGQVIVTAPRASDLRIRSDLLPRWGIDEQGRIGP